MDRHIWGYWDCPACGSKKIRADNKSCPNCATPVPPDCKFYIAQSEGVEYVAEEQKETEANWICEYCDSQNSMNTDTCIHCGSPRTDAHRDYFGERDFGRPDYEAQIPDENLLEESSENSETAELPSEPVSDYIPPENRRTFWDEIPSNRKRQLKQHLKVTLILFTVLTVIFAFIAPIVPTSAEVTGYEWERSISLEEYKNVDENGWILPQEANLHYTREEIKEYVQVLDHYETKTRQVSRQVQDGYDTTYQDLGNGQFKEVKTPRYKTVWETETYEEPVYRREPVYATKYYYDIDKWVKIKPIETMGIEHEAFWGAKDGEYPTRVVNPRYGDKRECGRTEKYWIVLKTKKGKKDKRKVDYTQWSNTQIGDIINRKVSLIKYLWKG